MFERIARANLCETIAKRSPDETGGSRSDSFEADTESSVEEAICLFAVSGMGISNGVTTSCAKKLLKTDDLKFFLVAGMMHWLFCYVLLWDLLICLEMEFYHIALEKALNGPQLEVCCSDQGRAVTKIKFTDRLEQNGVCNRMHGRGRIVHNS